MNFKCPNSWVVMAVALCLWSGSFVGAESAPSTDKIGKKIERVSFTDAAGKTLALQDLKDKKVIVVVFLSFDCPVSTGYSPVLAELAKTYGDRGAAFIGVATNDEEAAAQTAQHAADFKLPFPVYRDDKRTVADAFKANLTPEAFVLDRHFILRYRGRIDDSYVARLKRKNQTSRHDLRQALDEVLAGKPVTEPATVAIGCPIARTTEGRPAGGKVTFYRDVLPILQNNCQTCHRPGEVGPFALMTYKQAVNWAADIKEYTQSRQMPPWKPVAGAAFQNERKLSTKDITTLAAWVDGDLPPGDPKEAPPPRRFVQGWQMGQPDLVLTVSDEFQVGASGRDAFRCYVLPTNLPEDKYVTAVEVRPGNPRVVHHALLFADTSGKARTLEQKERERAKSSDEVDRGPGYPGSMGVGFLPRSGLGGWAPGNIGRHLPEGTGYTLPKGADVVMQVHYHRDGRPEKDRTSVGLYFATKPIEKPFKGLVVAGLQGYSHRFTIPASESHFRVHGNMWVDDDCVIHSVMPHMHLIGREVKITMTPPEGPTQTLVAIADWNYNWQETYFFKQPISVKAGTRFDIEAYFDNSELNPNNPFQPPQKIAYGEQTTNEMLFGFIGATNEKPGRIRQKFVNTPAKSGPAGDKK